MMNKQVKNQVRDSVEGGFDCLHRIADVVTFPLAPLDGAIHGTARGILNWLTDNHPEDRGNGHNHGNNGLQRPQNPPQPWNNYGPPNHPGQPSYYPGMPYPGYPMGGYYNKNGNNNGDNYGAFKFGNYGSN